MLCAAQYDIDIGIFNKMDIKRNYFMFFKSMFKATLSIVLLSSMTAFSMLKIRDDAVFAPQKLGSTELMYSNEGFEIRAQGKSHKVKNHFLDKTLRVMTPAKMVALQQHGYISINQFNDGEFGLRFNTRGNGGGPWLSWGGGIVTDFIWHGILVKSTFGLAGAGVKACMNAGSATAGGTSQMIVQAVSANNEMITKVIEQLPIEALAKGGVNAGESLKLFTGVTNGLNVVQGALANPVAQNVAAETIERLIPNAISGVVNAAAVPVGGIMGQQIENIVSSAVVERAMDAVVDKIGEKVVEVVGEKVVETATAAVVTSSMFAVAGGFALKAAFWVVATPGNVVRAGLLLVPGP